MVMAKARNDEDNFPLYHALDVLITDVDAVKDHAEHPDYKYKDRTQQLRSLSLLVRQYDLQNRKNGGRGEVVQFTDKKLLESFRRYSTLQGHVFEAFWKTGSTQMDKKKLNEVRRLSLYAQNKHDKTPFGSVPAVWDYKVVEEKLHALDASDSLNRGSLKRDAESVRSTPFSQSEQLALSEPDTISLKRVSSDTSQQHLNNRSLVHDVAKGPHDQCENASSKKPKKRCRTVSSESEEVQAIDFQLASVHQHIRPIASEDEFDVGETRKMMVRLAKDIGDLVMKIFKNFRLPPGLLMAFEPGDSQNAFEKVYASCWGQNYRAFGEDSRESLAGSDAAQSLISAYLYMHILESDGSSWTKLVQMLDGKQLYALLDSSIGRVLIEKDQTISGEIASMIVNCNVPQLQHYHQLVTQALPFRILGSDEIRREATKLIAGDFYVTLEPIFSKLDDIAKACNRSKKLTDWKREIQPKLHEIIDPHFRSNAEQLRPKTARSNSSGQRTASLLTGT